MEAAGDPPDRHWPEIQWKPQAIRQRRVGRRLTIGRRELTSLQQRDHAHAPCEQVERGIVTFIRKLDHAIARRQPLVDVVWPSNGITVGGEGGYLRSSISDPLCH